MTFMFEQLVVYQRTMTFITDVAAIVETFPRGHGYLRNQLGRASLSIATNLAEGNGRLTKADRRHFFAIARGSIHECVPLLELARRRDFIEADQHTELRQQLEEIAKMISGLIKSMGRL